MLFEEGVFVVRGGRSEDIVVMYVGKGRKEGRKEGEREGLVNMYIAQQCIYHNLP